MADTLNRVNRRIKRLDAQMDELRALRAQAVKDKQGLCPHVYVERVNGPAGILRLKCLECRLEGDEGLVPPEWKNRVVKDSSTRP